MSNTGRQAVRLVNHLVEWRQRYFVATLALLLLTSTQLLHMAFNGDIKVMFDRNDSYMKRLEVLDSTYLQSQFLFLMLEPADKQVFTRPNLEMLESITAAAWDLPFVERVDSLTNFPVLNVEQDNLKIDEMVQDAAALSPAMIQDLRASAMADSQIRGKLVSEKGNAAAVLVTLALPEAHLNGILEINAAADKLKQRFETAYPGLKIYLNGDTAIEKGIIDITMDDMMRVNPIVFVTIFLLTGIFLRSAIAIAATVAVVSLSTGIAMGILVSLGFDMNPITMMAPAIIMVIAVADSIHILTQFIVYVRAGQTPVEAMKTSLLRNARPVFWTSATTAIGFLGMNFGDSPPFRDMGNMASIGVLIAFVCTYTVLPFAALLLPLRVVNEPLALTGILARLSRMVVKLKNSLVLGFMLIVLALMSQIPRMDVNDDLSLYFDESLPIQESIQFARQNIQGVEYILYSMDAGVKEGINDPAFLHKVDTFANWLRQQPEVTSVESYVDMVKKINQAMNGNDASFYAIPLRRDLIAQYHLLYELSLPQGMDLTRDVSRDASSLRLLVNVTTSENKVLLDIERRIDQWLENNLPELRNQGTSQLLMFAHLGTSIIYSMVDGSLFTLVFITLMMVIGLKSWRFGLLSMILNVCPPIIVYGLWALLVGQVNHAAAMTFSICLGLVVDDTIHLISKYLDARRRNCSPEDAITEAFVGSGTAVVITSFTLASGILFLGLSHFTVNETMSLMLAGIIMTALVFDLVFLPALLLKFDREWSPAGAHNLEQTS